MHFNYYDGGSSLASDDHDINSQQFNIITSEEEDFHQRTQEDPNGWQNWNCRLRQDWNSH